MPKVKIIADSTCDLSRELLERYDVAVVPLYVTLGDQSYRDGVDMTVDQLFAHCDSTHEVPKTAASSVSDFIEAFRPFCEAGQDIVFLGISSHFSVQIQNALLAAQEFPERTIRCVDSQNLSTGIGLLVIEAAERAQAGMGANEIADAVEALRPKVNAGFVLDTLTYLRRGGRCSGLAALGARHAQHQAANQRHRRQNGPHRQIPRPHPPGYPALRRQAARRHRTHPPPARVPHALLLAAGLAGGNL